MVWNCSHDNGIILCRYNTGCLFRFFSRLSPRIFWTENFFKAVYKSFWLSVHPMPIRVLFHSGFISLVLRLLLQISWLALRFHVISCRYRVNARPIRITISLSYHYRYRVNGSEKCLLIRLSDAGSLRELFFLHFYINCT